MMRRRRRRRRKKKNDLLSFELFYSISCAKIIMLAN